VADNTRLLEVLAPKLTPLREGLATYLGNPTEPAMSDRGEENSQAR
jgi:hypothetical protein